MPSIEGGVHSALLAKGKVKLTDGWKLHVAMGIRNFTWITPTWAERQRTEHRQSWWASSQDWWLVTHLVPCKGTQHPWIVGNLVNVVIMSGAQTLVVKSDQEASIIDAKCAVFKG